MKIKYRTVYNRSNKLNKMGLGLIQIEAYQNGHKAYFSTNIFVAKDQYDGFVINHPHASELNGIITELVMKLEKVELDLWKHGISPNLDHLRSAWREKKELTDFATFAFQVVDKSDRKEHTKQNLRQTIRKVQAFRSVSLCDIDYLYLKDFEDWLRKTHITPNTIHKEMRNFRTLLGEAILEGLITENPFKRYKIPRLEKKEHIVLSEGEMLRIKKTQCYPDVRDAFLFCCHTGLRFSDYKELSSSNFKIIKGKTWLVYVTIKTGIEVRIPMYAIGEYPYPQIPSNAVVNRQLQQICIDANIKKSISFHTARHTFATMMLSKGVPITSVQQMLGHTSVRMTEKYAETTQKKLEADVLKAFRR